MKISNKGISLIEEFEGKRLRAYDDGIGVFTIGIGTIRYPNGKKVQKGDVITDQQAQEFLLHDLKNFEKVINDVVKVELTQNQYDAIVSLTYNIGSTAFRKSTLLRKLNAKDYKGAAEQFLVWNKAGGKVMRGLMRRREAERNLFLS